MGIESEADDFLASIQDSLSYAQQPEHHGGNNSNLQHQVQAPWNVGDVNVASHGQEWSCGGEKSSTTPQSAAGSAPVVGRKRRSRWDTASAPSSDAALPPPPPPPGPIPPTADHSSSIVSPAPAAGERKRKSRWADSDSLSTLNPAEILARVQLPSFVKELSGGDLDPEVQALNVKLLEIGKKLQMGPGPEPDGGDWGQAGDRSPSPEPVYDSSGVRVNTREARWREKLLRERQELISQMVKRNPGYKPPSDYRPPKLYKKLFIPQKQYPGHNFIGLIIGPRGNTQKRMEKESGAKIVIRGKGSVKEGRAHGRKDGGGDWGENEELHVMVEAESEESLNRAADMVEALLRPAEGAVEEHKRAQLKELAALNGTSRDEDGLTCRHCGETGHRQAVCPARDREIASGFRFEGVCRSCGDGGHPTGDCPLPRGALQAPALDEEYNSFLAELGGDPGSFQGGSRGRAGVGAGGRGWNRDDERSVYVGYMPSSFDESAMQEMLAGLGFGPDKVEQVKVIRDRATGFCKGYGFVTFVDLQTAQAAVQTIHGCQVQGKSIVARMTNNSRQGGPTPPPTLPLPPRPPPPQYAPQWADPYAMPPPFAPYPVPPPPGMMMHGFGPQGYPPPPGLEPDTDAQGPPGLLPEDGSSGYQYPPGELSYGGYVDQGMGVGHLPPPPPWAMPAAVPGGGLSPLPPPGVEPEAVVQSEYEKFMSEMDPSK